MSSPDAIWKAAAGTAKRRSVEMIFPELAAALDGKVSADADPAESIKRRVCVSGEHRGEKHKDKPYAAGRVDVGGPAFCLSCLYKLGLYDGGYPL